MGLREIQEKHGKLIAAGAAVILLLAGGIIVSEFKTYTGGDASGTPINKVYYFDLGKTQLVVDKNTTIPPVLTGDGKNMVRAYVYSCGDCKDATSQKIAYVEKFSPEAMAEMTKAGIKELPFDWALVLPPTVIKGWMVGTSDDKNWYPRHSSAGERLVGTLRTGCGADPTATHECLP